MPSAGDLHTVRFSNGVETMKSFSRVCRSAVAVILAVVVLCLAVTPGFAKSSKVKARRTTLMGKLDRLESEYVIRSGKTHYRVVGQDFQSFVGRKVKVTGTMHETDKGLVVEVIRIEMVKKKK